eukprot:TRINITY_DN4347_c0_g1_i1.p1 TRINITY_DN4347_c0_g1~~TRINITY_DN4347_c0_g1_i1.p1  ORF type:complete len:360 (-),score=83.39 TRINITY_DN4347_c0_g1_i1:36-1115(-)
MRLLRVCHTTLAPTQAGRLDLLSLSELVKLVEDKPAQVGERKPCEFHLVFRPPTVSYRYVDVAFLQAHPDNNGAMFQAASNFNAVESPSEGRSPEAKTFTEDYVSDHTQGPSASVSAAAAAITRVHAAFYDPQEKPESWQQTKEKQIKLLGDLQTGERHYFAVRNGYVVLDEALSPLPKDVKEYEELLGRAKIALHKDCQVVFGSAEGSRFPLVDPEQYVDQVFCAALNRGQGMSGFNNERLDTDGSKTRFCLDVAYQGTYLAALYRSTRTLHLTLIGGGVFGNSFSEIYNAIITAHERYANHPKGNLERVVLTLFPPQAPQEVLRLSLVRRLTQAGFPVRLFELEATGAQKEVAWPVK